MKKKIVYILGALAILVILFVIKNIFFTNKVIEDLDKAPDLVINNLNEYGLSKTLNQGLNLKKPRGIMIYGKNLLVADSDNNRLLLIDLNGKIIKEIGKSGNGECEFIKPQSAAVDNENNIYVLDSGNYRIQILNNKFEFVKQIPIKELKGKDVAMTDIVVTTSKEIYISVATTIEKYGHIYVVSDKGQVSKIGEGLVGHLAINNDSVYFVTGVSFFKDNNQEGVRGGEGKLLVIKNKKVIETFGLSYKYNPEGMFIDNNKLYIISGAFVTLDRYNLQGKYEGTVYKGGFEEQQMMSYCLMDNEKNIYISDWQKNAIYKLTKN